MTTTTLPGSSLQVSAGPLAACWLAAAAAGVPLKWDKRYDRMLLCEFARLGLVFCGVSPDLVVVAAVPYATATPDLLHEEIIESDVGTNPAVVIDDSAGGLATKLMRTLASQAGKVPGDILAAVQVIDFVPPDQMVGQRYVQIEADRYTQGVLAPIGTWSPPAWRAAMPGVAAAVTPESPLLVESSSAFTRLGRIAKHLPDGGATLEWEFYQLASGRTIRYVRVTDGRYSVEIAQAVATTAGVVPTIYDVSPPAVGDDDVEDAAGRAMAGSEPFDWDEDDQPDGSAADVIAATFGADD